MGNNSRVRRRRWFGRAQAGVLGALVLALGLLAGGGVALTDGLSASLLRQDAEAVALAWAAHLSVRFAEADAPAGFPAVERGGGDGVFRYEVFDRRGDLVFASDDPDRAGSGPPGRGLAARRRDGRAAARLLAGGTHVETARGAPPHRPAHYAEAYAPVLRDGAVLGVVGVHVDQTARRARYEGTFLLAEASAAALVLAAALPPLGLSYRRFRKRRAAEARQALLARELGHRAKNVLAVVQSVLRLTPKGDPAAYARAVEGRVAALARAHGLLAESAWAGVDLRVLADRELAPYTGCGAALALLRGPPVPLAADAVQPLAVVLHELATNAAKYGALSVPGGRVLLCWRFEEEAGLLRLRWAESGGPPVAGRPARRGFGSKVIDATARGQLGGAVAFEWGASGLLADIALPSGRVLAAPAAAATTAAAARGPARPPRQVAADAGGTTPFGQAPHAAQTRPARPVQAVPDPAAVAVADVAA